MQPLAYYNEIDPYAAAWLRNLIAAGHIAPGDVDERSIVDVQPGDLAGYAQCHFFAGIGGWSLSLRIAGWPDDRSVWTGSCPCQPFSVAGAQRGFADKRHLWPEFKRLIEIRRPTVVYGEQVASATAWLALVRGDLEAMDYAVGAIPIEAACADADHLRDRIWFVADDDFECSGEEWLQRSGQQRGASGDPETDVRPLPDVPRQRGHGFEDPAEPARWNGLEVVRFGGHDHLQFADGKWRRLPPPGVRWLGTGIPARVGKLRAFGNAIDPRPAAEFIASTPAFARVSEKSSSMTSPSSEGEAVAALKPTPDSLRR